MPLNKTVCDLGGLVGEACERLRSRAAERGVVIQWDPAPVSVTCDPDVISRVILNIGGNAVRFSPSGGRIAATVRREGRRAIVSFSDEGPGIAPQHHQRIFLKFGRVETGRDASGYSTGLGLAFCKLAVETHGGQIGVVSDVGRGSLFWFALPLEG